VGLGVVATEARRVTDKMFFAAARALADEVSQDDLARGSVYPPLRRIREVSVAIAAAVANVAYEEDLAGRPKPANVRESIRAFMYEPVYRNYL
jgi:malate dehydrogenase (oxaloacetate-decarboxylating)(NADP+)